MKCPLSLVKSEVGADIFFFFFFLSFFLGRCGSAWQKIVLGHYLHVGYRSVNMMFYVLFSFSSAFVHCLSVDKDEN